MSNFSQNELSFSYVLNPRISLTGSQGGMFATAPVTSLVAFA